MAVAALVVAIIGIIFFGFVLGPVAIILAYIAAKRIRESGGTRTGQGLATAAWIIGVIDIVLWVLYIVDISQ